MEVLGRRGTGKFRVLQGLQSRLSPQVDCGMNYNHQRGACGIRVTHVPAGVAPRVATWPGEPGQGF